MFGISLPIAATAVMLIGQTATDAAGPVFLGDIRVFKLRCFFKTDDRHFSQYGRSVILRTVVGNTHVIDRLEQGKTIHIDLQSMMYYVLPEQRRGELPDWRVVEEGVCQEAP